MLAVALRERLMVDAARLRALWSEHTTEDTLDFEDHNVRVIVDIPRRNDDAANTASELGETLAELLDGGPQKQAELIELLVQNLPLGHLRTIVSEMQSA
jgi:hypothetical protein